MLQRQHGAEQSDAGSFPGVKPGQQYGHMERGHNKVRDRTEVAVFMINLYSKNETDFLHNGLYILDGHIISPVVTEELNGLYMLEFDYPIGVSYAKEILPERIVKCPVPDMAAQLFRIAYIQKSLPGLIHVTAYHIFYDLVDNLVEDTFVVNKNGQQAITQILSATQYAHSFIGTSNISAINSARLVRLNPAAIFLDDGLENGFLSRWGGEIIRDNFHIYIQTVRGSDNGVSIRDKKNLKGYTSDVDFQSVCTRIMPQGFDGLFLPEKYVDSLLIGNYVKPKIRIIKYESVKAAVGDRAGDEDAVPLPEAYAMLRTLAKKEYSENYIDLPKATYSVAFAPLAETEEYKNFAALETINIGDTVIVVHEGDGLEIEARMISYRYDPFLQAYISITLGNYEPKFTDVAKDIKRVETGLKAVQEEANYALQSANGKNTNFYGSATPANPRIGDLWFRENGDKTELWVYEIRDGIIQWYPLLNDLTQEELKKELAEAQVLAEEAKIRSEEAVKAGEDAAVAASQAYQKGEEAKEAAEGAKAAGQDALTAGQNALSAAQQAETDAQDALTKANQAFDNAASALNDASNAASQAATANTTAVNAYNKSVKATAVTYAVSINGVTAPGSGWQSAVPAVSAGQFLWTRTLITLQDNSTVTSYSTARQGEDGATGAAGAKGDKGDMGETGSAGASGADAPTITAVREQYYLSTSKTAESGGSWNDTVPTWSSGKFYWTRVAVTYSNGAVTYSAPALADALNNSLVTALEAKTSAESLQTTVSQHATSISLNAGSVTTLTGRISAAETSLTVQAGQIAGKASQVDLNTLTGRVTTAESAIVQQADSFTLSLAEQSKIVNDLAGANLLQTAWQQGNLSTSTGAEATSTSYVRSGWLDVKAGSKYLLQTYEGASSYSVYGTAYLFYYKEDKTFLSYVTVGSSTSPFTVPANAQYLRVRLTTAASASSINCYLLATDTANGYTNLTTLTNMVKLQATTDTLLITVSETAGAIGTPFKVKQWERGSINTSTGVDADSASYLRSGYIDVNSGDRYIAQLMDGTSVSMAYFYYDTDADFISYASSSGAITVPANCEKMRVRAATAIVPDSYTGNVFTGTVRQDYTKTVTLYSALLMQKDLINLRVSKNDIINQINVSTEGILISGNKVHITGTTTIDNTVIKTAMIADVSITTAKITDLAVSTAKIANAAITNAKIGSLAVGSANIQDAAITTVKIGDAAITNAKIANLDAGKINTGTLAADRIAASSITSAKLSIANGFITNAMIADATIQSAKIAAVDAAKITTGTLLAARIAAGSITADKLAGNAIQVGLAGWTSSIRITPTRISWYDSDTLQGYIDSNGMNFYYGTRFVGMMGESSDASNTAKRGIATHLNGQGDYVTWAYRSGTSGTYTRFLTLDPRNSLGNGTGIHFGTNLWLNGYNLYTSGGRGVYLGDNTLGSATYPSWSHTGGNSRVTFGTTHLYFITNGTYYSCTSLMSRVGELISRVNTLISYLNNGWIKSITSGSNGSISWSYYSGTGLSSMSTSLS